MRLRLPSDDPTWTPYVNAVGQSLVPYVRRTGISYQFHVIDSAEVNAFAVPGGQVFVFTGMLRFLKSEAELAAILGHEISHVDLRHCIEKYQYELAARRVGLDGIGQLADRARLPITIAYQKNEEIEADAQGARLSIQAGYDPSVAPVLFSRIYPTPRSPGGATAPSATNSPDPWGEPTARKSALDGLGRPTARAEIRLQYLAVGLPGQPAGAWPPSPEPSQPSGAQRRGEASDRVAAREADRDRVGTLCGPRLDAAAKSDGAASAPCVTLLIVTGRAPPGRVLGGALALPLGSPSRRSLSPLPTARRPDDHPNAAHQQHARVATPGQGRWGALPRRHDGGRHRAQAAGQGVRRRVGRGQHRRAARRRAALGRARRFHEPGDRGHHARGGLRRRRARGAAPPRRLAGDQPVAGGRGRRRRAGPPAARARRAHRRGARRARHVHRRRGGRRPPPRRAPTSRCARCAPPCPAAR